jgi:hypothetical protein
MERKFCSTALNTYKATFQLLLVSAAQYDKSPIYSNMRVYMNGENATLDTLSFVWETHHIW